MEYKTYTRTVIEEAPINMHGMLGGSCFISGWASVCDVVDQHNDVITKQALEQAVQKWLNTGKKIIMLMEHDLDRPLGLWEKFEITDKGLFVEGKIIETLPASAFAKTLLSTNKIYGLSIGYKPKQSHKKDGVRFITDLEICEISVVRIPANPQAIITCYTLQ